MQLILAEYVYFLEKEKRMKRFSYFEDVCLDLLRKNNEHSFFHDLFFFYHSKETIKKENVDKEDNKKVEFESITVLRPLSSYSFYVNEREFKHLDQCKDILNEIFGDKLSNPIYPHTSDITLKKLEDVARQKNWLAYNFLEMKLFILIRPVNTYFKQGKPNQYFIDFVGSLVAELNNTIPCSLNALNESSKKTRRLLKEIINSEVYNISVEKTLSNLISYFKHIYGASELQEIFLYKNDFKNNTWETFDSKFDSLVKEKIENFYYRRRAGADTLYAYENRMPISFKEDDTYFLLVPVAKNHEKEYFRYAILIANDKPIEQFLLKNLDEVVSYYFSSYIEEQKRTLLADMQMEFFKNISVFGDSKQKLKELAEREFEKIVQITNAYSATIRLYNPAKGSLQLFVDKFNENENAKRTKDLKEIFFTDYQDGPHQGKSIHWRMFLTQERYIDDYPVAVYEGRLLNYYKPKKTKHSFKKNKSLPAREQTASEFCVPLYFKQIKIGTINFESPIVNGFDSECILNVDGKPEIVLVKKGKDKKQKIIYEKCVKIRNDSFLYAVKIILETYYILLFENNDSHFTSRLIERESNFHDLNNLVDSNNDLNLHRERITKLLGNIRSVNENSIYTFGDVLSIRTKKIANRKSNLGDYANRVIPELESSLPVNKSFLENAENIKISGDTYYALEIIYSNLLANFFKYGNIDRGDRLGLYYDEHSNCLFFKQKMSRPFPILNGNDRYFETLIRRKTREGESIHSGLFIVGVLTRQLGGYIYHDVDEEGLYYGFKIRIKIQEVD